MNLRYNQTLRRFEAEFSTDFAGDLAAVKTAGFRTDGPPVWAWWTDKIKALNALREHRPESGLSINQDALEVYETLTKMAEKNAEVKKQFAETRKKVKKEQVQQEQEEETLKIFAIPEGKMWIGPEDFPYKSPFISEIVPIPSPPSLRCSNCGEPVYFYEQQDPPLCLWCEIKNSKKVLDKESKLC